MKLPPNTQTPPRLRPLPTKEITFGEPDVTKSNDLYMPDPSMQEYYRKSFPLTPSSSFLHLLEMHTAKQDTGDLRDSLPTEPDTEPTKRIELHRDTFGNAKTPKEARDIQHVEKLTKLLDSNVRHISQQDGGSKDYNDTKGVIVMGDASFGNFSELNVIFDIRNPEKPDLAMKSKIQGHGVTLERNTSEDGIEVTRWSEMDLRDFYMLTENHRTGVVVYEEWKGLGGE